MFFGFGPTLLATVLILNAIAVFSEDRFLARIGWLNSQSEPAFGQSAHDPPSVKSKLINWSNSVRTVMRLPLIVINTAIIIWLMIFG